MMTVKERSKKAAAFKNTVRWWASQIGTQPGRIQIQRMTKKWASCSTSGRICYSADLLKEDISFQEVVIVHELLHLRVPNHGKLFKSLMKAFLPKSERIADERINRLCGYRPAPDTAIRSERDDIANPYSL